MPPSGGDAVSGAWDAVATQLVAERGDALVRYAYLQTSVLIPYIALAPSIVAGGLTLGVMQQVIRAFGRVEDSFQYLVRSWTTIVSLISVYKRLRTFEATLRDEPLDGIEAEAVARS